LWYGGQAIQAEELRPLGDAVKEQAEHNQASPNSRRESWPSIASAPDRHATGSRHSHASV